MSETWKMPTWMREVWNLFGDLCPTGAHNERIISVLTRLRTAGLLQTPEEKDSVILDMGEMITVSVLETRCAILEGMYARLRTENADLLENYKRADQGLRECCDSKERIRTENWRLKGILDKLAGAEVLKKET